MGRTDECVGFCLRLSRVPCAHFDQQEPASLGQQRNIVHGQTLAAHEIDEHSVKAFQADGPEFKHARHGVGGLECVGKGQCREYAKGRTGDEVQRG